MFDKLVIRPSVGLFHFVLTMLLLLQLGAPADAQTQPPADLTGKNVLVQEAEASVQSDLATKKVLILHSFAHGQVVYQIIDESLARGFASSGVDFNNLYFEYMDIPRNPSADYIKGLSDFYSRKFKKRKIDLIVAIHTEALNFLEGDGGNIFPRVPVISFLANPNAVHADPRRRVVAVPVSVDAVSTVKDIMKLAPDTRKLFVVSGSAGPDRRLQAMVKAQLQGWQDKTEIEYVSDLPMADLLKKLSHLPPKAAILYITLYVDSEGKPYQPAAVARVISASANAPAFGLFDTHLGDNGIVGGSLLDQRATGQGVVQMAIDILQGKLPTQPLTILPPSFVPTFDWLQLKRWDFRESALPADAMILNKPVSPWERYKLYVIAALTFCLLETVLIFILIAQRRRKKVAEDSLQQKKEELDQSFNVTLDLLCIANTDGYFLRLNPAWERVLGYTREELMAKRFLEFVHPDDLDRTLEAVSTLTSQQKILLFENRYRSKDGTYRWLQWSAAPAGRLIYAAARDVTDSKLAEESLVERLRFEQLVSDLSGRFVNITPNHVDREIEDALRRVADFFHVTNCALVKGSPDRNTAMVTHAAYPAAATTSKIGMDVVSLFPWSSKRLREGEAVTVATLDDLPAEAAVDKETYKKLGVRSILTIPVSVEGSPRYTVSIASRSETHAWPEELIPRLRLVGEIFASALERKQIRLQIEERLRFERLISDLSAGFVNLPPDEVDGEINQGLRSITEFFDADRCSIGLFFEDGTQLALAFEYYSPEAEPALGSITKEQMPWYLEQLIRGKPVVMNRVEELPPEAEKERQICLSRGMKSVLSIPIVTGGKTLGSCALVSTRAERVWPEEYIPRLRLLAQIFTSALERQRMQEEIQNAAKEWQATFDSVQDLVMILDGEFKVSRVNAACLYFFNLPPEKVVKDYCYTLMHGTSKPVETCPLAKMLKTKRHEEVELYDETRKAWFHVSVDPILDDKGEITRVVHTVKDITERRGAEAEAFEARREMLRLERLSRMGELTASLAHELNQPLTSILSNARAAVRFLEAGKVNVEELKEILRDIAQDDKRAGDIVRSLRSMVKTEEGEMETAAIAELLGEAVSLFKGEAIIRNVEVEVDVAPSLPLVRVNRVQIQQVMINLMMNAAEAMEAEAILDRRLIIRVSELDGAIQAAFRDFGKGIDISETSRLFEPFFTTKTTGLGMGLSLSRSIMESHGGHIWAENNRDKGATFYFDLPMISKE